jgi:hypothetical protein
VTTTTRPFTGAPPVRRCFSSGNLGSEIPIVKLWKI